MSLIKEKARMFSERITEAKMASKRFPNCEDCQTDCGAEFLVAFKDVQQLEHDSILVSKKKLLQEWRSAHILAEKYRDQTIMTHDEYVMIKAAQEIRNMLIRLLLGFEGKCPEVSNQEVEELLKE